MNSSFITSSPRVLNSQSYHMGPDVKKTVLSLECLTKRDQNQSRQLLRLAIKLLVAFLDMILSNK